MDCTATKTLARNAVTVVFILCRDNKLGTIHCVRFYKRTAKDFTEEQNKRHWPPTWPVALVAPDGIWRGHGDMRSGDLGDGSPPPSHGVQEQSPGRRSAPVTLSPIS